MIAVAPSQPAASPEAATRFHLQEHQHVCASLDWLVRQFHTYAVYSGIGAVAIFAWLSRYEVPADLGPIARYAWYLPAALVGTLSLAQFAVYREIRIYAGYLRRLEDSFAEHGLGFQQSFDNASRVLGIGWVSGLAILYSVMLFLGSLAIAARAAAAAQ